MISERQKAVLAAIPVGEHLSLYQIAERAFPDEPKAYSWVRNQLRLLRREGLVKQVGRGLYSRTTKE